MPDDAPLSISAFHLIWWQWCVSGYRYSAWDSPAPLFFLPCFRCLLHQAGGLPFFAASPFQGEGVACFFEAGFVGEEKQPGAGAFGEGFVRFDEAGHSRRGAGDGEDAEIFEVEQFGVKAGFPRRVIGHEFAVEGGLPEIAAHDRHGGAVGFQEEVAYISAFRFVEILQAEHLVRNDTQGVSALVEVVHRHAQSRWVGTFAGAFRGVRQDFLGVDQAHPSVFPAGDFEGDHEVGGQQGVFQEDRADAFVFGGPVNFSAQVFHTFG